MVFRKDSREFEEVSDFREWSHGELSRHSLGCFRGFQEDIWGLQWDFRTNQRRFRESLERFMRFYGFQEDLETHHGV